MTGQYFGRFILIVIVVLAAISPTGAASIPNSNNLPVASATNNVSAGPETEGIDVPAQSAAAAMPETPALILLGTALFLAARFRRTRARR